MRTYKALAWDDRPESYLIELIEKLKDHRITVEFERERRLFLKRFLEVGDWDFVILDMIDDTHAENVQHYAGIKLAGEIRAENSRIPIIIMTAEGNYAMAGNPISEPVLYRSKSLTIGDMIIDINRFVRNNARDYSTVFIIYGHNRKAGGILGDVRRRLEDYSLRVETVTPEAAMSPLSAELIRTMSPCGGFVAICTPDDRVCDGKGNTELFQPRQNVLLEIGMVMGMPEGPERLVILQRWGSESDEQARLPTDLDGILPTRFYDDHNYGDQLDELIRGLKKRGLRIDD